MKKKSILIWIALKGQKYLSNGHLVRVKQKTFENIKKPWRGFKYQRQTSLAVEKAINHFKPERALSTMGQSLVKITIHLIFLAQKNRQTIYFKRTMRKRLFKYLGGSAKLTIVAPIQVGVTLDHVHTVSSNKNMALSQLLEGDQKTDSSKWMKKARGRLSDFVYWPGWLRCLFSQRVSGYRH